MKRTDLLKTYTLKKQLSYVYRFLLLLVLAIISLVLGLVFKDKIGYNLLITSSIIAGIFFILLMIAIFPILKELIIAKSYEIYEGRIVEFENYSAIRMVYFVIEYESPLVSKIKTNSCFNPTEANVLLGKKVKICVSKKSKKAILIP